MNPVRNCFNLLNCPNMDFEVHFMTRQIND